MAKKNIIYRSKLKNAKKLITEDRLGDARDLLLVLSRQAPRDSEIWFCLGVIAGKSRDPANAAEYLGKAVELEPENSTILYNYGIALRDTGNFEAAINAFKRSLVNDARNTEKLDCLAHALMSSGRLDEAAETFLRSLHINPDQAETHSNLGSVNQAKGMLSDAENCYRKALAINPQINIAENLGSVLVSQGRFEESIQVFQSGIDRQPTNHKLLSNYLLTLNYLVDITDKEILHEHLKFGARFDKPAISFPQIAAKGERKIRVGYCSPDFREHSVAYFIEPVIENHDREKYDVFAYNLSPKHDTVTDRLRSLSDHWRNIAGETIKSVSERIVEDKIDILVDLAGHTAHNCLLAFAEKPAPVQITYLGYPNTTGMNSIRFRLTDYFSDPEESDQYYSERLLRLPNSFLCYRPQSDAPKIAGPPCQSADYFTFGSFNNLSKINSRVIATWSDILRLVENSRLLVKNPSLTDMSTRARFYHYFGENGIDQDRVSLVGHTKTRYEHLSMYNQVDVALDTFPYNGTTTTCEALWMGVPVITLMGTRHASRVGSSILNASNMTEWIARNRSEYTEIAIASASNSTRLDEIRYEMRDKLKNSTLCDARHFTRDLESIYQSLLI